MACLTAFATMPLQSPRSLVAKITHVVLCVVLPCCKTVYNLLSLYAPQSQLLSNFPLEPRCSKFFHYVTNDPYGKSNLATLALFQDNYV